MTRAIDDDLEQRASWAAPAHAEPAAATGRPASMVDHAARAIGPARLQRRLLQRAAAKDPLHVGHHTDPHAGPFEREIKHGDQHRSATDAYNRGTVHSDKPTAHVFGRPGVVSHGEGLFQLKHDAIRYTYTAKGHVNVAVPFDVIEKDKLLSINHAAPHLSAEDRKTLEKEEKEGRNARLALNPSPPRQLHIDGKETWCVLSWTDSFGGGAAWIPVGALAGDTSRIRKDVQHRAERESPSTKLHPSTPYLIRDDDVGQADAEDRVNGGRVLAPGAKSGDNVSHYLEKDMMKPAFGEDGQPTGKKVSRGFVALCMNLPEGKVPPVATDTALAGDTFFAFNSSQFHREVAVYENGAHRSHRRQMWVFGHLGKHKGGEGPDADTMEPDPARCGWLPLRVLKLPGS